MKDHDHEIHKLIHEEGHFYVFDLLYRTRQALLNNNAEISINDLGAGSKKMKGNKRKICDIARYSLSKKWQCEFLFRLIDHFQLKNRIEMGSSLGLSALYQYLPLTSSRMITLEGCPQTANFAQQLFRKYNCKQLEMIIGDFDQTLTQAIQCFDGIDYIFIDGNHTKAASIRYFYEVLPFMKSDGFIIVDDIHWSSEMKAAWQEICTADTVGFSLDLFLFGVIQVNTAQKTNQTKLMPPIKAFF